MTGATSIDIIERDAKPKPPSTSWSGGHPVDIRLSIPLPGLRFYVTLVGGREKRSPDRRAADRGRYPIRTAANLVFFLGLAMVLYLAALFVVALQASILEF